MIRFDMRSNRRMVVKLGSSSITRLSGPNPALLASTIDSAIRARAIGWDVIVVSSGAVSSGLAVINQRHRDDEDYRPHPQSRRQLAAAVGQPVLQSIYRSVADISGHLVAQILVGEDDMRSPTRTRSIAELIDEALLQHVIPIVNGNDALDRAGLDNDAVAASIAVLVGADRLLLLTDSDGVYLGANSDTYEEVLHASNLHDVGSRGPGTGRGGIRSKLRAAELASSNGISTRIASAHAHEIILKALSSECPGTLIPGRVRTQRNAGRYPMATVSRGRVVINREAEDSIVHERSSLFSSGIKRLVGDFQREDVIEVVAPSGQLIARGVTRMSSALLGLVRAMRSDEVAVVMVAVLQKVADPSWSPDRWVEGLPEHQSGRCIRGLRALDAMPAGRISMLGAEILTLFPVEFARLLVSDPQSLSLPEQMTLAVSDFAVIDLPKLEVLSPHRD